LGYASLALPSGLSWCLRLPVAAAEVVMERAGAEVRRDPLELLADSLARAAQRTRAVPAAGEPSAAPDRPGAAA